MGNGDNFSGQSCPAIVGPTASGKTALVTALASQLPIEVISLDSRQIYHGLRIGTAQPTAEELAVCRHHLIDFVSPDEKYDAVRYRSDFENVFKEIKSRDGIPLLVGGAGMYLTALREGFMKIPFNTDEKLEKVRAEVSSWDDETLRAQLLKNDPDSYHRIHPNDVYRSGRAMEIFLISGQTMTELMSAQKNQPSLGLNFPAFVLQRPVDQLDDRIARRTEIMLDQGWIAETEEALKENDAQGPGLRSIGYREIVEYLSGDLSREELSPAVVLVTRQYAKRQRTWFRNMNNATEGHPESEELLESLLLSLS